MAQPKVHIRRAEARDAETMAWLWVQFMNEQANFDARFGVAEDAPDRWKNDFEVWVKDEGRRILVAEEAGQLVGFATAHQWRPPPVFTPSVEVMLAELYVIPQMRGGGIGSALTAAVRDWAEHIEADRIRIHVLAANESGQVFWKRQAGERFVETMTIELEAKETEHSATNKKGRLGF